MINHTDATAENIRLSDPQFEPECLRFMTIESAFLKGRGDVSIFVPPGYESYKDLPMALFLHGVYGSHWSWAYRGGIHRMAAELIENETIKPMVLVMPSDGLSGPGSGYAPQGEFDYERWIMEDVVNHVADAICCLSRKSNLFIAGLSMGGFGALRLGAKYADRVCGVSAHSAVTDLRQLGLYVEKPPEVLMQKEEAERTVLYWLLKNKSILPPLRFDCGKDDKLIIANRELHQELSAHNIPHHFSEFDGGHDWSYWRKHAYDTLLFFNQKPILPYSQTADRN